MCSCRIRREASSVAWSALPPARAPETQGQRALRSDRLSVVFLSEWPYAPRLGDRRCPAAERRTYEKPQTLSRVPEEMAAAPVRTRCFSSCVAAFQGGGCRAAVLVGALDEALSRGVNFVEIAGPSAGSIVAALMGAGQRRLILKRSFQQ